MICKKCLENKPETEFGKGHKYKDRQYILKTCKVCMNLKAKERRYKRIHEYREKAAAYQRERRCLSKVKLSMKESYSKYYFERGGREKKKLYRHQNRALYRKSSHKYYQNVSNKLNLDGFNKLKDRRSRYYTKLKNDNQRWESLLVKAKARSKNEVKSLKDGYIKKILSNNTNQVLKPNDFSQKIINLKRAQLKLYRTIYN